jgi:hypothetical protein
MCLLVVATSVIASGGEKLALEFTDPLGTVELAAPPIGEELEQTEREMAPKLCKEIRFLAKDGPAAVLVSTRIRAELPKDDRVLERVEPKYKAFQQEHGNQDVHVEFRGQRPHRTLEFAVAGGEYQEMFPYVVGGHIGTDNPPKSITISQFFVESGRMFEMAVFLPNDDKIARPALFARARKVCDEWRTSVAVKE